MRLDGFTSGIWQTNTTVLSHRGACLVIDPAYFPRELAAIAACVAERSPASGAPGPLDGHRAVAFTHGHWDHVMGHGVCAGAPVWMHEGLAKEISGATPTAARYLERAREFDSRWYVPRVDGHRWPTNVRPVADGERMALGSSGGGDRGGAAIELWAMHLPGHSPDGLGLMIEELGVLLVGDYLSPCEIPFIDDAAVYRGTLMTLIERIERDVRQVIPGHGPLLTAAEALAIARADVAYVEQMIEAGERNDAAAALAVPLPRAADVVGMLDAHRENCGKVGIET